MTAGTIKERNKKASATMQKCIIRLSVKEFAKRKRITERTVYRWIEAGVIEAEQPAPNYAYEIIVREWK